MDVMAIFTIGSFLRYDIGHVPVGHEPPDDFAPAPTPKVDMSFSMRWLPHFSHMCRPLASAFSSTSMTCPHFAQRYSYRGMTLPSLHGPRARAMNTLALNLLPRLLFLGLGLQFPDPLLDSVKSVLEVL